MQFIFFVRFNIFQFYTGKMSNVKIAQNIKIFFNFKELNSLCMLKIK